MNRFGWCAGLDQAPLLRRLGYDFIELAIAPLRLEEPDEHERLLAPVLHSDFPVRAFNILFPGGFPVVGPEADEARIRRYLASVARVCSRTGAEVVVFGSGKARHAPDGWERERAEAQLLTLLSIAADELQGSGATLVIEPLNRKESNMINSVDEGTALAKQINRPEVRVLADFYHMDEEQEPLETLRANRDWLAHIHLADTGRRHPGSGQYDYATFAALLKEIGYTGMISAECRIEQPELEMAESLAFIKRMFA